MKIPATIVKPVDGLASIKVALRGVTGELTFATADPIVLCGLNDGDNIELNIRVLWGAEQAGEKTPDGTRAESPNGDAAPGSSELLLDEAISLLARWTLAVQNDTSWDGWDEYYKDAAYRPGLLRDLIDARRETLKATGDF